MPVSISPVLEGYVLDTNVLSLLAKEGHLALLETAAVSLYITPVIQLEIDAGIQRGVNYLTDVVELVENGAVQLISLIDADRDFIQQLPSKSGEGEAEAIAVCHRQNLVLITHDRKAVNYCDRNGIGCIPLLDLLAEYEMAGLLTAIDIDKIFS